MSDTRTVPVALHGGPHDGHERDQPCGPGLPGEHLGPYDGGHYRRSHLDSLTGQWHYRWWAERTGKRQPCRAGDDAGCVGGRCPSGRRSNSP